ncbi:DinB family protein [soil metagenome]
MSIAQAMLNEFEHEAKVTRQFLERIPKDKLNWRPHEKSHTAGELGSHIANLPALVSRFVLADSSAIPDTPELFKQPASVQKILDSHEKSIKTVSEILPKLDDARLMTSWSALRDGKPIMTVPKVMVLRIFLLNHWIHHRGQLGVYLRLMGASVPASYGPSGDEG